MVDIFAGIICIVLRINFIILRVFRRMPSPRWYVYFIQLETSRSLSLFLNNTLTITLIMLMPQITSKEIRNS